jgi:chromosome segregation ATPase
VRFISIIMFMRLLGGEMIFAAEPSGFNGGTYPESALIQTEKEEQQEALRLEEAKAASQRYAQEYEQNKADTEREIRSKRRRIEDLKIAQESLQKDQEFLKAELTDLQKKNELVQKRYKDLLAKYNDESENREALKKDIEKRRTELKQNEMSLHSLESEISPPKRPTPATLADLKQSTRWTLLRDCPIRQAPDESAKAVGMFHKSKFVFGQATGNYIKSFASSGAPVFFEKKCAKESVTK